jgi:hypothetical protein
MSGRQHFLDKRLTDGGEVVNLTLRQPFTTAKFPDAESFR